MGILPEDKECGCGYWIFKLPLDHPFTRACNLHDYEFGLSEQGIPEKTKDRADIELFWRWALIAKNQPSDEETLGLIWDIIKFWPLARGVGELLWDRDPTSKEIENVQKLIDLASSRIAEKRENADGVSVVTNIQPIPSSTGGAPELDVESARPAKDS